MKRGLNKEGNSRLYLADNLLKIPKSKRSGSHLEFVFNFLGLSNSKRSQISVFVILAVIVVAVIVVYFIVNSTKITILSENKIHPDIQPVYSYIENCVFETGEDAIEYIGVHGGYYKLPELSIDIEIPYYLYERKNFIPLKEEIEEQISLYVNENLNSCISEEELSDFQINFGEIKTKTLIEDEKVIFNIEYPLSIKKGENSYTIKNFNTEIPVRLGIVYDIANNLVANDLENPRYICLPCIDYFSEKYDIKIKAINYNEKEFIFTISDENSKINDNNFILNYVNKYD